jgi:type IV secretory pathway TraG/TraD family ATPase VirD4
MNHSEQRKTRKLFEASRFLKLKTGHCILINPGYSNKEEAAVPIQQAVELPWMEIRIVKRSVQRWQQVRQYLFELGKQRDVVSREHLQQRYALAEEFFKDKKATRYDPRKVPPLDDWEETT